MIHFDMRELEEVIKYLMIEKFGSIEEAIKSPIVLEKKIYKDVDEYLQKTYSQFVEKNSNDVRAFIEGKKGAYNQITQKIIKENK